MNHWKKQLMFVVLFAVLFAAAMISVYAVPGLPGAGHVGEGAACHSHTGSLITLDSIPTRAFGGKKAPDPEDGTTQKNIPLVVIVMGFENIAYNDDYDWGEKIFESEKSLTEYYNDMSFGQFTFLPVKETSAYGAGGNTNTADGVDDGVIHVNLPKPHRDWICEDATEDASMLGAFIDAINGASAYMDFSAYDADHDGYIYADELAVGFIVAGYEGAATDDYSIGREFFLWSHAWDIGAAIEEDGLKRISVPRPDGVYVSSYIAIAEELDAETQEPISVLAHELGHYLGLPDYYDTDYNEDTEWADYEVGDFSVMAGGSWGVDPDPGCAWLV